MTKPNTHHLNVSYVGRAKADPTARYAPLEFTVTDGGCVHVYEFDNEAAAAFSSKVLLRRELHKEFATRSQTGRHGKLTGQYPHYTYQP